MRPRHNAKVDLTLSSHQSRSYLPSLSLPLCQHRPADFEYFSGFCTQFWESPTRPYFLLLPLDDAVGGGWPIAVVPEIQAEIVHEPIANTGVTVRVHFGCF